MKLENQVCSLELAKRLKELGVKQESAFFWSKLSISNSEPQLELRQHLLTNEIILADCTQYCSAFTVSELGDLLPKRLNNCDFEIIFIPFNGYEIRYRTPHYQKSDDKYIYFHGESSHNLANSAAKMLIYLIENKLMEMPK